MPPKKNRYEQIIEDIFLSNYHEGDNALRFSREDIIKTARKLNIRLPKNVGDVVYSFRYRQNLPSSILAKAPGEHEWIIMPDGTGKYKFLSVPLARITPSSMLMEIKVPDSTPGIIDMYALNDEQALLAKLRYNRLIDVFTGLTCYSLQNHLRTTVPQFGQVETDEIYIGIDKHGVHYVITVQAKGGSDKIGVVQIEQDIEISKTKFPNLLYKPIAAQFMENNLICLFEFVKIESEIKIAREKHYRLVPPGNLSAAELEAYKNMSPADS